MIMFALGPRVRDWPAPGVRQLGKESTRHNSFLFCTF